MFIKKRRTSICRELGNYLVPKVMCALVRADITKKHQQRSWSCFRWLSVGEDCCVTCWDTPLAEIIVEHRVEIIVRQGKERKEQLALKISTWLKLELKTLKEIKMLNVNEG